MIVFAAIAPHSPLLVPTIGKEQTEQLAGTIEAYRQLANALYLAKPDALVIISPHAPMYPDAFSVRMADGYVGTLKEFGDHGTEVRAKPDFLLIDRMHRAMRLKNIPFSLTSSAELDYGFTVPLLSLAANQTDVRLVPLAPSRLPLAAHADFGRELKDVLHAESKRIAVIASADLSHHANAQSPQGFREAGERFDRAVREAAAKNDLDGLLALPPELLEEAGQCGFLPIVILLGMLDGMHAQAKELSYEAPFGVGYLTVQYGLS